MTHFRDKSCHIFVLSAAVSVCILIQFSISESLECERENKVKTSGSAVTVNCISDRFLDRDEQFEVYRADERIGKCKSSGCSPIFCLLHCQTDSAHENHVTIELCGLKCFSFSIEGPLLKTDFGEYYVFVDPADKVLAMNLTNTSANSDTTDNSPLTSFMTTSRLNVSSSKEPYFPDAITSDKIQSTDTITSQSQESTLEYLYNSCVIVTTTTGQTKHIPAHKSSGDLVFIITILALSMALLCSIGVKLYRIGRKRRIPSERLRSNQQDYPGVMTRSNTTEEVSMTSFSPQPPLPSLPNARRVLASSVPSDVSSRSNEPPFNTSLICGNAPGLPPKIFLGTADSEPSPGSSCVPYEESTTHSNMTVTLHVTQHQMDTDVSSAAIDGLVPETSPMENMYCTVDDIERKDVTGLGPNGPCVLQQVPYSSVKDMSNQSTSNDEEILALYAKPSKSKDGKENKENYSRNLTVNADESEYDDLRENTGKDTFSIVMLLIVGQQLIFTFPYSNLYINFKLLMTNHLFLLK